jgi:hypothetical protein
VNDNRGLTAIASPWLQARDPQYVLKLREQLPNLRQIDAIVV